MTKKQTVSERIVDLLEAEGIRTLFGIPDPGIQLVHRIAADRGWNVIAAHHETAGGFMADAMTRMTGKPAIISGNQGPGVANMVPAAICASKEKVPVIFLAEQRARRLDAQVRRGKFQYTPQSRFFEAAMKYVGIIEFAEQVDEVFQEAFRMAMSGTPGPVYIEYPEDHSNTEIAFPPLKSPAEYRITKQKADPASLQQAAELIRTAKSPLLLSGTAVHISRAHKEIKQFAELLQCPVIPTWGGRGSLPETHPQTLIYSGEAANAAIAAADIVIAVGTSIGEPIHYGSTHHWAQGNTDRKWIYIERDATNVGVNRKIDVPLVGNLKDILPQLQTLLKEGAGIKPNPQLTEWRLIQDRTRQALFDSAPDTYPIHPGRMIVEATRAFPDDAVVVRDGGMTTLWELAYHELRSNDYLWTSKFGHLGAGMPYAIGAQLAVGDKRRVCLITGDSAFQFHISELETAVRKQLPIVIVINSDSAWAMEHPGFVEEFGENRDVEVKWGAVRFDKIAEGFGAYGEYVDKTKDIAPAVKRALEENRPAVVQVAVDAKVNGSEAPNWDEFVSWYGESLY
ncbi:MAG: thiamine pyrophosphate-binding protein [Gammaproteobacteria bacterium]